MNPVISPNAIKFKTHVTTTTNSQNMIISEHAYEITENNITTPNSKFVHLNYNKLKSNMVQHIAKPSDE